MRLRASASVVARATPRKAKPPLRAKRAHVRAVACSAVLAEKAPRLA